MLPFLLLPRHLQGHLQYLQKHGLGSRKDVRSEGNILRGVQLSLCVGRAQRGP